MKELQLLIDKFWAGQTTEAENQRLLQLLDTQGGELRQQIQAEFGRRESASGELIKDEKAQQLLAQIHARYHIQQPAAPRLPWLRRSGKGLSVAACLLILAGIALFKPTKPVSNPAQSTVVAAPSPAKLIQMSNTSDSTMTVVLKDGSIIQLQKNSGVSYYEPFISNRRDISLSGIALFKVAKDKARPFSVYAGGTITRVLGTQFLVNASGAGKVMVRLLEGSIAVETRAADKPEEKAILLKAGQEIAVNKMDHSYIVSTTPAIRNNGVPARKDSPGLAFTKESLTRVFRKIGASYGITINYDPKEMQGLYFTGTFLPSDELNSVLATICNVNDLSFKQEGKTVLISRQLH